MKKTYTLYINIFGSIQIWEGIIREKGLFDSVAKVTALRRGCKYYIHKNNIDKFVEKTGIDIRNRNAHSCKPFRSMQIITDLSFLEGNGDV